MQLLERESPLASLAGWVSDARTVDHHVSAILGKLHAPTRSAAARRAAALGLAGAERSGETPPG